MSNNNYWSVEEFSKEYKTDPNYLNKFILDIADSITGACMIPINLPKREIYNIIKRAVKWFHKNYEYSLQENYVLVPVEVFSTETFLKTRSINLSKTDSCVESGVFSVIGAHRTGNSWTNLQTDDFDAQRILYGKMYNDGSISNSSDALTEYVVYDMYYDLARHIFQAPISYDYSFLTKQFKILGEIPNVNIVLHVLQTIPDSALFEDEIFFRYVEAQVLKALGSKLSMFSYTLPGNVEINADSIKDLGTEALDAVLEEIKNDEGADWFMTT